MRLHAAGSFIVQLLDPLQCEEKDDYHWPYKITNVLHWILFIRKILLLSVRKLYQLDANNFIMIFSHKWPLHVSDIYMSVFRSWLSPCVPTAVNNQTLVSDNAPVWRCRRKYTYASSLFQNLNLINAGVKNWRCCRCSSFAAIVYIRRPQIEDASCRGDNCPT